MKRKTLMILAAVVICITVSLLVWHRSAEARQAPQWRFVEIERGDLSQTISATGALSAVTTVAVGTQVSGQVAALHVDFNDRVVKGQLLARIDPTLALQAVTDAEASLERARAQLLLSEREHVRNQELAREGIIAGSVFDANRADLSVARANVKSAQVAVERARQNLEYTSIHAPIDGVVVERNVDLGQTVAASLSAPQLFLIAQDLAQMQILAQVDEADIARIHDGQTAEFSVQALPGETFRGAVRQVRLQSSLQENVVNYTVVIQVENLEQKLLPGMTARVDFLVEAAEDVLTVPNAALRFRPSDETAGAVQGNAPPANARQRTRSGSRIFVAESDGTLRPIPVETGITDGRSTEIRGEGLEEGMNVVAGTFQADAAPSGGALIGGGQQSRRAPGGF